MANARPTINDSEIEPNERLSKDSGRLSPITNTWCAGIVIRRLLTTRHCWLGSVCEVSCAGR